ncbi:MAG: NAD(P)-dependent oxidoreductase [Candidatus Acidiferrales bacterium]
MNPFTPGNTKLAFIGLGNMGSRIAARLLAAGYAVAVFDRNPAKMDALRAQGATLGDSPAALAESVQVVLSCLTDDQSVRDVYYGPGGILAKAHRELVILEMSTVSPATSRELAQQASGSGVQVLDVAISGSTPAVEAGTLTLLAGGNPDVFAAGLPIFQAIAKKYFHLGPSGAGTTMKLVVNSILGVGMQVIAEAAALGEKAGLSRDVLLQVLSQTAVISPAHAGKLPKAARDDYAPQFPFALMNKDLRLALQLASEVDALMPATAASYQTSSEALPEHGDQDFSVIVKFMEQLSAQKGSSRSAAR